MCVFQTDCECFEEQAQSSSAATSRNKERAWFKQQPPCLDEDSSGTLSSWKMCVYQKWERCEKSGNRIDIEVLWKMGQNLKGLNMVKLPHDGVIQTGMAEWTILKCSSLSKHSQFCKYNSLKLPFLFLQHYFSSVAKRNGSSYFTLCPEYKTE